MIAFGVCMHAGQGCATPTSGCLLPRARYDEGVDLLRGIYESRSLSATLNFQKRSAGR